MNKPLLLLLAVTLIGFAFYLFRSSSPAPTGTSLVISLEAAPLTVDPVAVMDIHSSQVSTAVHAPLAWVDQSGRLIPMVAKKMEVTNDARKLSITIDPDVTFWNGARVTVDDVFYTLERYRKSQNLHRWILDRVTGIKEFDEKQSEHISGITSPSKDVIEIAFSAPEPDAASMLCNLSVAIVQKGSGESPVKPFGVHVIGCGPYAPSDFEPSALHCTLRHPAKGKADELMFRPISDDAARLSALRSKDVSMVRLRGPMIAEVCDSSDAGLKPKAAFPNTVISTFKVEELSYIVLNWQSPKLASVPELRRRDSLLTLSQAIDRAKLESGIFPSGCAEATASIAPPSAVVVATAAMPDAPTGMAFPNGLTLVSANDSASRQIAVAIQNQLLENGIKIETEFVDIGKLIEKLVKKDFDLLNCWIELQVPSSGPYAWCSFFDRSSSLSAFGEGRDDIGDLLAQARGVLDPKQRAAAFAQVVSTIDSRQSTWLPLLSRKAVTAQQVGVLPFFDANGTPVNGLIRTQP